MKKVADFVKKRWFRLTWGVWKQAFPKTKTGFEAYCDRILFAYDIPERNSFQYTIATMIMHHDQKSAYQRPRSIAEQVYKAMANEIAFGKIEYFRDLDKKEAESIAKDAVNGVSHVEKPTLTIQSSPQGMVQ